MKLRPWRVGETRVFSYARTLSDPNGAPVAGVNYIVEHLEERVTPRHTGAKDGRS